MMRLAAKLLIVGMLGFAGVSSAAAQRLEQFFDDIGRLGQPRRSVAQEEWERISSGELRCVDDRLRRNRRSVSTLIARGIGPSDNRVAGIVSDCRSDADAAPNDTATPSFNCNVAKQPDEQAICSNSELARLDRTVVQGYEHVLGSEGARVAKGIAEPLLQRRHDCGPDIDCIKRVQLAAIAAFQERGAPVQAPAAAHVTAPGSPSYAIDGIKLGGSVGVGSANYNDYTCAPSQQYAGFTGCQRQTAQRSRRRQISESTAFLHAADGSAVYINQSLDAIVMDDNDARDEIDRLSATFGEAKLLPTQDDRGEPNGLIASWGAVSLQPLAAERRAALAAGTDDKPGILIDSMGNLQRSAQLGLPIYQLGGGAGYVWSASWNGRRRGTLRMLAIDASKLPGVAEAAKPEQPAAAAPAVVAAAPTSPAPDPAKPADAPPPPPPQKVAEPTVAAPPPKPPAPAADVRVVGPPIELRASAPAAVPTTTPTTASSNSNGLVIFLTMLVVVLLGAVGYLWRKSRIGPATVAAASVVAVATPEPAKPDEAVVTAPESEKMNLQGLVPAESPDSIAASVPEMDEPKAIEAVTPAANAGENRSTP